MEKVLNLKKKIKSVKINLIIMILLKKMNKLPLHKETQNKMIIVIFLKIKKILKVMGTHHQTW